MSPETNSDSRSSLFVLYFGVSCLFLPQPILIIVSNITGVRRLVIFTLFLFFFFC
jgi:hypothetical protein